MKEGQNIIGSKAIVINNGRCYTTHPIMEGMRGFRSGTQISNKALVTVKKVVFVNNYDEIGCIVEDTFARVYLINIKGLYFEVPKTFTVDGAVLEYNPDNETVKIGDFYLNRQNLIESLKNL